MLQLLDGVLFALHCIIIGFNLTGWIWTGTRRLHIACLGLTLGSWVVLGIWKGWGYCFLTDWEWAVKSRLGETDLPPSFIQYVLTNVMGFSLDDGVVDMATVVTFALCILMAIYINWLRPYSAGKRSRSGRA